MRRTTIAAVLLVLCPAAASAASPGAQRPQLEDPDGDWPVPSADITAVTLSTQGQAVRVRLDLSGPPSPAQPTAYVVSFAYPGCQRLDVIYQYGAGVPAAADGSYTDSSACADGSALVAGSDLTDVSVSVTGSSVIWSVPLSGKLRRGARVTNLRAHTSFGLATDTAGVRSYLGLPIGDDGTGHADYVVGR